MTWNIANRKGLSFTIRVNQLDWNKIFVVDRIGRCNTKRIFKNCLDWSPDVDDLKPTLEKSLGFVRKMMSYAAGTSCIGLVDVYSLNGAAEDDRSRILIDSIN